MQGFHQNWVASIYAAILGPWNAMEEFEKAQWIFGEEICAFPPANFYKMLGSSFGAKSFWQRWNITVSEIKLNAFGYHISAFYVSRW